MTDAIDQARNAVWQQLAKRHEHFAELQQLLHAEGRLAEAEGAKWHCDRILRALTAELDNPKPEEAG